MKIIVKNCLFVFLIFLTCSCSDWLDGALPKNKNLDDVQFSTVEGIHSVMNGLYSRMTSTDLYGGKLTMTDIELLAHYYYYENQTDLQEFSGYQAFRYKSEYNYGNKDFVIPSFDGIWNAAYILIFEINTFIKNLEESTVLPDELKNVLMGEAYGLRAFVHFDLYRLYSGKVIDNDEGSNIAYSTQFIPYNHSPEVIPHDRIMPDEFIRLLLQDIDAAIYYLQKNDPILTVGIIDFTDKKADGVPPVIIFEYFLRNYRMNYYAARALKARILMYIGNEQEAAQEAQEVLNEAFGAGKIFNWANFLDVEKNLDRNYIFYEEVIFGLNNPDLYTRWKNNTGGTSRGSVYAVHEDVLRRNIFGNDILYEGAIYRSEDVRTQQWTYSLMNDAQYISKKYERFEYTENNPKQYFQPLIRTGELWYIIAEAALKAGNRDRAVDILDHFYVMRGAQANRVRDKVASDADVYSFLETEYYKEFYGEGQAWFFIKRQSATSIFSAREGGRRNNLTPGDFFPGLPQKEIDFE